MISSGFESCPSRSTRCQKYNVWPGQVPFRVSDRSGMFVFFFKPFTKLDAVNLATGCLSAATPRGPKRGRLGLCDDAGLSEAGEVVDDAALVGDATVGSEVEEQHFLEREASTGRRHGSPRAELCA